MNAIKLKAFIRKDMRKLTRERADLKSSPVPDEAMKMYLITRYHTLKEILEKLK